MKVAVFLLALAAIVSISTASGIFGFFEQPQFFTVPADINGTDINVNRVFSVNDINFGTGYSENDGNMLCVGNGNLCMDWNGTDGRIF